MVFNMILMTMYCSGRLYGFAFSRISSINLPVSCITRVSRRFVSPQPITDIRELCSVMKYAVVSVGAGCGN